MLFATPDFGAKGVNYIIYLVIWCALFLLAIPGVVGAIFLSRRVKSSRTWIAYCLLWFSGSLLLAGCLLPWIVTRANHGPDTLGDNPRAKVKEGMSEAEATALFGNPHQKWNSEKGICWCYYYGSLHSNSLIVEFNYNGKVERTRLD